MTLKEAEELLLGAGIEDARHEARIIFAEVGGEPLYKLLTPSYSSESPEVEKALKRRAEREPLAYVIGAVDFYNERYKVTPDCLIPRADTEILVDFAVKHIPEGESFVDLCTGSGCVAVSTLANTKGTRAIAADISEGALSVARENAEFMGVANRVDFKLFDVKSGALCERAFAVLSNPPYVSEESYKTLEPEIYKEPREAFVGGADGGDFYRILTPIYRDVIDPRGFIAYEIGFDQRAIMEQIAEENGMNLQIIRDLGGRDRVAVLWHKG